MSVMLMAALSDLAWKPLSSRISHRVMRFHNGFEAPMGLQVFSLYSLSNNKNETT